MTFFLYISVSIALVLASDNVSQEEPKIEHDEEKNAKAHKEVALPNMQFAVNLYKHITSNKERQPQQNILFSPLSISTAFSMLSLGAKSTTHKQILESLKLNGTHMQEEVMHSTFHHVLLTLNKPKSVLQLNIGNAIFVQETLTLLQSFEQQVKRQYHAEVLTSDFTHSKEAVQQINDYVKSRTEGNIEKFIKDLSADSELELLNYIFFNGEWENTFNPQYTHVSNFFVDDSTTVKVQMMSRMGKYKIFQDEELHCIVLQLPYKNNAYMLLVIPELGKIHELERALSIETITRWKNSLRLRFTHLYMPKFSITSSIDLTKVLSDMGMQDVFTDRADFSGITKDVQLKVSKATHKATLDVDEKGTKAAAVTTIEFVPGMQLKPGIINKPFFILICSQDTNSILFMGTIMNPTTK